MKEIESIFPKYSVEYLVDNIEFRNWVIHPNDELNKYWKDLIGRDAELKKNVEVASRIVNALNFEENTKSIVADSNAGILKHRILNKNRRNNRFIKISNWIGRVAAILVIPLIIYSIYTGNILSNFNEDSFIEYAAPKGQMCTITLEDGTTIWLNSGSNLKYHSHPTKSKRKVFLEGEAWFDVEKNKKHLFIVHTPFYDVNVTGTKFNVKAYGDDTEVVTTLEEGEVKIVSTKSFNLAEDIILKPGEQIVFNKESREIHLEEVNTKLFTSWKDNKLTFINMKLKELIVLLERRYGIEIEVQDASILDLEYDGTFTNETMLEVLDLIKLTLPVKYHIEDQLIVIERK